MQADEMIPAEELCNQYKIEYSFIADLQQYGLIDITAAEHTRYISQNQLQRLEQILRLHFDLDINLEGIDAIANLLEQISGMQAEITTLRNRLKLYEKVAPEQKEV
jgi:DNA-binding transcriptional MerR regulator